MSRQPGEVRDGPGALSYLLARNLWVSAGAHIINEWSLFFLTFAGSHAPAAA